MSPRRAEREILQLTPPTRAFVTRELRAWLAAGRDPALTKHLLEVLASGEVRAIRQLEPASKRALLELLDARLAGRSAPDPKAIVELTGLLLPSLPGDPAVALGSAPAR